ncbi:MAG: T9SS type A sorting domain-containing protein [bacterium]|nr:T9SS type A sorting domain-containing protein [bacterium]
MPAPCITSTSAVPEQGPPARRGLAVTGYPNPFNPQVDLRFAVPQRAFAEVAVFDAAGRLVRTLLSSRQLDAGPHVLTWHGDGDDGRSLPSGTYLARVRVGDRIGTQKLSLVR